MSIPKAAQEATVCQRLEQLTSTQPIVTQAGHETIEIYTLDLLY